MKAVAAFAERLAPDTINRLERAAQHRYESATILFKKHRRLEALYLFGYVAEICLATATPGVQAFRQTPKLITTPGIGG